MSFWLVGFGRMPRRCAATDATSNLNLQRYFDKMSAQFPSKKQFSDAWTMHSSCIVLQGQNGNGVAMDGLVSDLCTNRLKYRLKSTSSRENFSLFASQIYMEVGHLSVHLVFSRKL